MMHQDGWVGLEGESAWSRNLADSLPLASLAFTNSPGRQEAVTLILSRYIFSGTTVLDFNLIHFWTRSRASVRVRDYSLARLFLICRNDNTLRNFAIEIQITHVQLINYISLLATKASKTLAAIKPLIKSLYEGN